MRKFCVVYKIPNCDETISLVKNPDEDLQAVFVHGKTDGQVWVAGSVNWARAGRVFKLETCAAKAGASDCYLWKEMDSRHW